MSRLESSVLSYTNHLGRLIFQPSFSFSLPNSFLFALSFHLSNLFPYPRHSSLLPAFIHRLPLPFVYVKNKKKTKNSNIMYHTTTLFIYIYIYMYFFILRYNFPIFPLRSMPAAGGLRLCSIKTYYPRDKEENKAYWKSVLRPRVLVKLR